VDVLIAGGGPVGLVLAVELARRGVEFRLVDRADRFFGGSRADGIQPRSLEVFADLGLVDTMLAEGDTGIPFRAYRDGEVVWEGTTTEPMPARPDVPYPNPWFVPQYRTEELLRERLAQEGHHVEQATELVGFTQDDDGVTAVLRTADGRTEQVRACYLVGADGGRSTVRKHLGVPFHGETDEDTQALIADVRVEGLGRDHGWMFLHGKGGVPLMPLAGTDLFTVTATPPSDGEVTLDYLQRMVTEATGGNDVRLTELTWATTWRSNARLAERFRVGNVFLAGDAAHVCPPTGGQGMNTGIQDSYNLGWKLAAVLGGAPAALLDTYEAERIPTARAALALAAELLARHQRGEENAHRRGEEVHQLGLHYEGGPLAEELRVAPGPVRAGDRAPDAPCRHADGSPVTLFQLCRGTAWTVLAFGQERRDLVADLDARVGDAVRAYSVVGPGEPTDEHTVVDVDGLAAAAYGAAEGTVVLIRPDGYVGLATDTATLTPITDYLALVSDQRR
jgi:2-polyprenyl-6-methoxyphenol hydroxylase-like FAD-dependent oxidoreductase